MSLLLIKNNNKIPKRARFTAHGPTKVGPITIRAMTASFGSRLEETVKKTIIENPIVVYSRIEDVVEWMAFETSPDA